MKRLIIIISFLIFGIIACNEIDKEKYELIKAIIENPTEYESIIKNSKLFKNEKLFYFDDKNFIIDYIEEHFNKEFDIYDIENFKFIYYKQDNSGKYNPSDTINCQNIIIGNKSNNLIHFIFDFEKDSSWTLVSVGIGKGRTSNL
ncbi:MAG: hypothetical protein V1779_09790 [bacterium]